MIINLRELMTDYIGSHTSELKNSWSRAVVYCPDFSETAYEVCELQAGQFISQANGEDIGKYVKAYLLIEDYL